MEPETQIKIDLNPNDPHELLGVVHLQHGEIPSQALIVIAHVGNQRVAACATMKFKNLQDLSSKQRYFALEQLYATLHSFGVNGVYLLLSTFPNQTDSVESWVREICSPASSLLWEILESSRNITREIGLNLDQCWMVAKGCAARIGVDEESDEMEVIEATLLTDVKESRVLQQALAQGKCPPRVTRLNLLRLPLQELIAEVAVAKRSSHRGYIRPRSKLVTLGQDLRNAESIQTDKVVTVLSRLADEESLINLLLTSSDIATDTLHDFTKHLMEDLEFKPRSECLVNSPAYYAQLAVLDFLSEVCIASPPRWLNDAKQNLALYLALLNFWQGRYASADEILKGANLTSSPHPFGAWLRRQLVRGTNSAWVKRQTRKIKADR